MSQAIVTAGPQGAGKTTFCKEIQEYYPDIVIVERDAILIELFGNVYLDPYTGAHQYCERIMWERITEILSESDDVTLILDTWLGWPQSRNMTSQRLRRLGTNRVDLWYFTTPEEACLKQYETREASTWANDQQRRSDLDSCRKNFHMFHSMPIVPEDQEPDFDNIKFVNPMQLTFVPYPLLMI